MTVTSLHNVLPPPVPCSLPSTLAIDGPQILVSSLASQTLNKFHENPHLFRVFTRAASFIKQNRTAVWCWDGGGSWRTDRRGGKVGGPKASKEFLDSYNVLQKEASKLLTLLGCPSLESTTTAESLCCHLNRQGVVDCVVSDDSDCFCYGFHTLFRLNAEECWKASSVSSEEGVKLSRDNCVAFACLTGSDETPGVRRIGERSAMSFLAGCGEEENALEVLKEIGKGRGFKCCPSCKKYSGDECPVCEEVNRTRSKIRAAITLEEMAEGSFPPSKVLRHYLSAPVPADLNLTSESLKQRRPCMNQLLDMQDALFGRHSEDLSLKVRLTTEVLKLVVRYDLIHGAAREDGNYWSYSVSKILASRRKRDVECFDVEWEATERATGVKFIFETTECKEAMDLHHPHSGTDRRLLLTPSSGAASLFFFSAQNCSCSPCHPSFARAAAVAYAVVSDYSVARRKLTQALNTSLDSRESIFAGSDLEVKKTKKEHRVFPGDEEQGSGRRGGRYFRDLVDRGKENCNLGQGRGKGKRGRSGVNSDLLALTTKKRKGTVALQGRPLPSFDNLDRTDPPKIQHNKFTHRVFSPPKFVKDYHKRWAKK